MTPDQETVLVARYQSRMARIGDRAQTKAREAWDALGSYDAEDINRLVGVSQRLWGATRTQAVNTSSGFYSLATDTASVGVHVDLVAGVPPSVAEAFHVTWKHLSDGAFWDDAVSAGREAFARAHLDATYQAARYTGDVWERLAGRQGFGWRRVLVGVSCEWCALVSTQVYRSASSAAFGHDRCDCAVMPMNGDTSADRRLSTLYGETNVGERVTRSKRVKDLLGRADRAQARSVEAMSAGRVDEARELDRQAQRLRVEAAEQSTVARPSTSTGYVDVDGHPVVRPDT